MECEMCGNYDFEPERCDDCGGNGDTGAPCELPCEKCGGTGRTDYLVCEVCDYKLANPE